MPSFQVATTFLGQVCGAGQTQGVNPEMRWRLLAAEEEVRAAYDALAPSQRIEPATGRDQASFAEWAAVTGPHVCWLPNARQHSAGAAIDINPASNPYIVTRNGLVPGGEPGGEELSAMRNRALAAYDRAMRFATPASSGADLAPRRPGESTASVFARFKAASDALVAYLSFVVPSDLLDITRPAVEDADEVSDDELLATIGESERLPLERAHTRLEGFASDPRTQYLRILRDYEHVRIPMAIGGPSASPARTRNPVRGFLNLRAEIVTALCAQGLRWGACDFEVRPDGSSDNGAMMHFDLADNGGYGEVNSLLRFG